jgi:uncharacterized protein YunC (DUF1805 family)
MESNRIEEGNRCKVGRAGIMVVAFGLAVALGASFAPTRQRAAAPLMEIREIHCSHGIAHGVAMCRPNGKPLAVLIRADRGTIVCMHFSLEQLEGHGIPAASVQAIKSIEELLETKVVGVNKLASALGVQAGMPVRDALEKMMEKGKPGNTVKEDYAIPLGPASERTR